MKKVKKILFCILFVCLFISIFAISTFADDSVLQNEEYDIVWNTTVEEDLTFADINFDKESYPKTDNDIEIIMTAGVEGVNDVYLYVYQKNSADRVHALYTGEECEYLLLNSTLISSEGNFHKYHFVAPEHIEDLSIHYLHYYDSSSTPYEVKKLNFGGVKYDNFVFSRDYVDIAYYGQRTVLEELQAASQYTGFNLENYVEVSSDFKPIMIGRSSESDALYLYCYQKDVNERIDGVFLSSDGTFYRIKYRSNSGSFFKYLINDITDRKIFNEKLHFHTQNISTSELSGFIYNGFSADERLIFVSFNSGWLSKNLDYPEPFFAGPIYDEVISRDLEDEINATVGYTEYDETSSYLDYTLFMVSRQESSNAVYLVFYQRNPSERILSINDKKLVYQDSYDHFVRYWYLSGDIESITIDTKLKLPYYNESNVQTGTVNVNFKYLNSGLYSYVFSNDWFYNETYSNVFAAEPLELVSSSPTGENEVVQYRDPLEDLNVVADLTGFKADEYPIGNSKIQPVMVSTVASFNGVFLYYYSQENSKVLNVTAGDRTYSVTCISSKDGFYKVLLNNCTDPTIFNDDFTLYCADITSTNAFSLSFENQRMPFVVYTLAWARCLSDTNVLAEDYVPVPDDEEIDIPISGVISGGSQGSSGSSSSDSWLDVDYVGSSSSNVFSTMLKLLIIALSAIGVTYAIVIIKRNLSKKGRSYRRRR